VTFVSKMDRFPELSFEATITQGVGYNFQYTLVVTALGSKSSRAQWQKEFDFWCSTQSATPIYTSGKGINDRTEAKVVFYAAYPLIDFLVRWIGLRAYPHGDAESARNEKLRSENEELREQNLRLRRERTEGSSLSRGDEALAGIPIYLRKPSALAKMPPLGRKKEQARVIVAATFHCRSIQKAKHWYWNTPIGDYQDKTAAQLVEEGRWEAVLCYIRDLETGGLG